MNYLTLRILPLVMILVCCATTASAGMAPGNFIGTFDGSSTLTPTGTPGVFIQNFSGDGDDSVFGPFTPSSHSTIDFSHPPNIVVTDGTFLLDFGGLGTLFGTTSGGGMGNGAGMATFSADLMITGGTGLFGGAAGDATITGTITQTSPTTESLTASYNGTVTIPEPSTVLLLLAGSSAVALRRRSW